MGRKAYWEKYGDAANLFELEDWNMKHKGNHV